jgi:hypothetical protein
MHSIEYDYAPQSFRGIWNKNYLNQGDRPLRNADNYFLPNPRTELFKKSPLYALPLKRKHLDDNRYIRNRTTFKTSLKYNFLSSLMDGTVDHGIEPCSMQMLTDWSRTMILKVVFTLYIIKAMYSDSINCLLVR